MKIDGIEGLRVSIRVGGSDLQEYDDLTDQSVDPSKAVKQDVDSMTENHDGKFLRRLFQFADLTTSETNDDASKWLDVQKVKSLGEIKINFRWCRKGKTTPAERANLHVRYSGQNAIPEKCLKGRAISSQAVLGAGKPCTGHSSIHATYPYGKQPFATYVFRYRSHRDLQIEGIIPRSPSPEPGVRLEERDPATLSAEEARELVRILRERHGRRIQVKDEIRDEIKREGAKRANSQIAAVEDDDDLTVLSEGRSSKRMRGATDEVVDCIDLTGT
ncbi:hypothetical protein KC343_g6154 [Hortaea werneckii]|nr:hypothetical protein KC317_g8616 [Hortaea werneckii]KAI7608951.1 hypothetical protein KC346_g9395 [Hortaea werneckii]KAI7626988.1 hypothetical protein KC343_g6154 [Hortaea werneckii]KAI7664718.1 hypothetical protein KC319_g7383 [Hortaea werneckii]